MEIKRCPFRSGNRPFLSRLPLTGVLDEKLDGVLVHDSGLDAFQPIVEPAKRFISVLVKRTIEVNSRSDGQLFRALPSFEGPDIAGKMKGISFPVPSEVSRDGDIR